MDVPTYVPQGRIFKQILVIFHTRAKQDYDVFRMHYVLRGSGEVIGYTILPTLNRQLL